ncbi:MAG: DUF4912 domain-containing protein [Thermodesulfovibrionales bacterium]
MRKQELAAKGMAELRTMAREAGIKAGRSWKKEDFINALSERKAPARKTRVGKRPAAVGSPAKKAPSGRRRKRETGSLSGAGKGPAALPVQEERALPAEEQPSRGEGAVPSEYREDKIVTLAVTPQRLYVYWEVTEKSLAGGAGSLNLKIVNALSGDAFYLPVSERVGEYFVSVSPGSASTAAIGVIDRTGEFTALVTERSATPAASARARQQEPPPVEWTEPVPRVLSIIFASPRKTGEGALPEEEVGRPEDIGLGIPEEYPDGDLQTGGLPGEFFAAPEFISSAAAAAGSLLPGEGRGRERDEGLPEDFFSLPESISSY